MCFEVLPFLLKPGSKEPGLTLSSTKTSVNSESKVSLVDILNDLAVVSFNGFIIRPFAQPDVGGCFGDGQYKVGD